MKNVIQLDDNGYFSGVTVADESPLEVGVYLMPANAIDAEVPAIPDGHLAKWDGAWMYEPIPAPIAEPIPEPAPLTYAEQRAAAYPSITDQLDQIYHEGLDAWKATILAVKQEFPKP